jgi:hypothetical protein
MARTNHFLSKHMKGSSIQDGVRDSKGGVHGRTAIVAISPVNLARGFVVRE